jgi:Ribonuclease I
MAKLLQWFLSFNCANTPFSITSATQNLIGPVWQSYTGNDTEFWEHEWSKHGTCVTPTIQCDNFFSKTANLYQARKVLQTLSVFKIVPSDNQKYTVDKFLTSFAKTVNIQCALVSNVYYLSTVQFCYDLYFNWIDCQETTPNCGTGFLIPLAYCEDEN